MIVTLVGEKSRPESCLFESGDDSQAVTASHYVLKPRVYLNDHNDPRPLDDLGMKKQDFQMLEKRNIKY